MTRRAWFPLVLSMTLANVSCASRVPPSESNIQCVNHIEIPIFPAIADSARVTAKIGAVVILGTDGVVQSVSLETISGQPAGARLFSQSVEKAARTALYASSCAGKHVSLMFDFHYPTRSEAGLSVQMVAFEYPNRFRISVTPSLVMP